MYYTYHVAHIVFCICVFGFVVVLFFTLKKDHVSFLYFSLLKVLFYFDHEKIKRAHIHKLYHANIVE